jgi:hypothetical protein
VALVLALLEELVLQEAKIRERVVVHWAFSGRDTVVVARVGVRIGRF